jgi:hypothetical protein
MASIMQQHRQRFEMLTSKKTIILKHITFLDYERIVMGIMNEDPEYEKAQEVVARYKQIHKALSVMKPEEQERNKLKPEQESERRWAYMLCAKYLSRFYPPCFVQPKIESMEDFDGLLSSLQPDEREAVYQMCTVMASHLSTELKNFAMLEIAIQFGIKWADDLFITNMTLQQYQMALEAKLKEGEAIKSVLESTKK